eukprot:SAG31_NODE_346_length_17349_cov_9.825875_9_plen_55_part_00
MLSKFRVDKPIMLSMLRAYLLNLCYEPAGCWTAPPRARARGARRDRDGGSAIEL